MRIYEFRRRKERERRRRTKNKKNIFFCLSLKSANCVNLVWLKCNSMMIEIEAERKAPIHC